MVLITSIAWFNPKLVSWSNLVFAAGLKYVREMSATLQLAALRGGLGVI